MFEAFLVSNKIFYMISNLTFLCIISKIKRINKDKLRMNKNL